MIMKNVFVAHVTDTQEIMHLKEAGQHYHYDNYFHRHNVTVRCNNFTGIH